MVVAPIPPKELGPVILDNVLIGMPLNPTSLSPIACIFDNILPMPGVCPGLTFLLSNNSSFNLINRLFK